MQEPRRNFFAKLYDFTGRSDRGEYWVMWAATTALAFITSRFIVSECWLFIPLFGFLWLGLAEGVDTENQYGPRA